MDNRSIPLMRLSDFVGCDVQRLPLPAMVAMVTAMQGLAAKPGFPRAPF